MNVGCHVRATPHIPGQVFVSDNPDGVTIVDVCDRAIIKPCVVCPTQMRAYHTYSAFKVYYNTNRPFEEVVSNFALNVINCSDFANFTTSTLQFDVAIVADDLCAYGSSFGIPPFAVTIRHTGISGVSGPNVLSFNAYTDCSSIPSVPTIADATYKVFINGLNCGITFEGATQIMFDLKQCLSFYQFFTTPAGSTYNTLAIALCAHITAMCNGIKGHDLQINLVDSQGNVTMLVDLTGGCDVTTDTTTFVLGETYDIRINDTFMTSFTVTL